MYNYILGNYKTEYECIYVKEEEEEENLCFCIKSCHYKQTSVSF